jgi:hypothetical protein
MEVKAPQEFGAPRMSPDRLAQLRTSYPSAELGEIVKEVDGDTYRFTVKCPGRPEWQEFRTLANSERSRPQALETLARRCVIEPDAAGLDAIFLKKPALAEAVGGRLVDMAGGGDAQGKKL